MRILVITERYPPYYLGGYEIACEAVVERLRRRGHEVRVLTSTFGVDRPTSADEVHRLLHGPHDSPSLVTLAGWERADRRTIKRMEEDFSPDVTYAWCLLHLFASVTATLGGRGAPVVTNIQDLWIPEHLRAYEQLRLEWLKPSPRATRGLGKAILRSVGRRMDPEWLAPVQMDDLPLQHLVFCSEFQRRRHLEAGLPVHDARLIYNGVDVQRFGAAHRDPRGRGLRLLFVGRMVPNKGAHVAVEAVAELRRRGRSVTLTVIGPPSYPPEYESMLRQAVATQGLDAQVVFRGPVANKDLPAVYGAHDVLVFPSRHLEGLPMTVLEAMACGVVVVASVTGGTAELLDEERGLVFATGDTQDLAGRIESLLDHPERLGEIGTRARNTILARFDIEAIADQSVEYLAAVAGH